MSKLQPYVVRQGDHLLGIAAKHGFDADEIWGDPANADIKASRGTHNLLLQGDVVQIPMEARYAPLKIGGINKYTVPTKRCTVVQTFHHNNAALANLPYRVVGGIADEVARATDANGTASFEVSALVDTVKVVFKNGLSYLLKVGHLDPVLTASGAEQRLIHLGFLDAAGESANDRAGREDRDQWVAFALATFQSRYGLPSTGELDAATAQKLAAAYGC
jgi:hypothetical protein